MTKFEMPIEVWLRINDVKVVGKADTKELLITLQDTADRWFEKQIPSIPCEQMYKTKI
jgi:hypothetical protein